MFRPQGVLHQPWDNWQLSHHQENSTRFPQLAKLQFHPHYHHSAHISVFSRSSFKTVPTYLLYMFWSCLLTPQKTLNMWESLSQCRTTVTASLCCAGQDSTEYQTGSSQDTFTRLNLKRRTSEMRSKILVHNEMPSFVVQNTRKKSEPRAGEEEL